MEQQQIPATFSTTTNTLAIVSLVAGIVSWFAVPVLGGIVAVIAGHMARSQIRRTGERGDGMATAGLILGYLHLAVVVLLALLVVLLLVGLASAPLVTP
jgi:hypothetical protein